MAKRGRRRKNQLEATAEGIGRTLGQLANRLEAWRKQRSALATDVQRVVTSGQAMLKELGQDTGAMLATLGRRGRAGYRGGRRPGFKMSAAARAKISAAQKARWAKRKGKG